MPEQKIFWSLNIKYLRGRKKMNENELAEELGISYVALHAHENGQTINPSLNDLLDFSQYFKVSVDILVKTDLRNLPESDMRTLETGNDVFLTGRKIKRLTAATKG